MRCGRVDADKHIEVAKRGRGVREIVNVRRAIDGVQTDGKRCGVGRIGNLQAVEAQLRDMSQRCEELGRDRAVSRVGATGPSQADVQYARFLDDALAPFIDLSQVNFYVWNLGRD